jgi:predicted hydrocarbon binding protein
LTREAGPIILYQLGQGYGLEVGLQGKEMVKEPRDAVKFLEYYGLLAGWGRFETSEFRLEQGQLSHSVIVKIYDNFFAHASPLTSGNPGCFFISGLLAGVTDGLLESYHNCLEEKCISSGSEYCQFVIAKAISD